MRKKLYFIFSVFLMSGLLLGGCRNITTDNADSKQAVNNQADTDNSTGEKNQTADNNTANQPTEEPLEQKTETFSRKQAYSDADREVSILGLKEYKTLKSDKYTDKASSGKRYLVLFLKIKNNLPEKDYFNTNCLTAKLDGKPIENTFLLNEPEGYPTIFENIESGSSIGGFVVWEVPKNWKKLEVSYTGWQPSAGLSLECTLTKKDLKKPEKYSGYDFY